ncbi:MAG: FecCD family ABC transporter permease [Clostridiaceae bacterium]
MKKQKIFIISFLILILCMIISFSVGRYKIPINTIFYIIKAKITGQPIAEEFSAAYTAFWIIRVPRTIMAVMVGAVLGVAGTVFQGIFRNPLVSPDILGISQAASFGAGAAIICFGYSLVLIQSAAFIFSLLAILFALSIGLRNKKNSITSLVIAGIVVSSLFSAGTSILKYLADPYSELPAIEFWAMGAFNKIAWDDVMHSAPIFIICILIIYALRWYIDIISLEEEEAISLGVNVKIMRIIFILLSTFITATSIAYCGIISWISLIIPHVGRFLVGPEHKKLIPFSILIGAIFTVLMDTMARTITAGEIPLSIITSCIGAPFLGYLLIKYNKAIK